MANSAIVGILRALLTADTAEFDTAMKRAGDSAKEFSKDAKAIGTELTKVGSSLTQAITLPLAAVGAGAAKLAIDFESSFAGVRKTVDATDAEFAVMSQSFRDLAKEIPINVNELNRLGEAAGALGIPKAEIVDFARVMALLGETTNVTADQAASSIAKIQNIFQAAGQETDRFAATLVDLGNKGASTEAEILELANRISSAGHAVGMSQADVLGFASAIANVGIEAEKGGSAISKTFGEISIAVSQGGADLAAFAKVADMSSESFANLFREDAAAAVTAVIEGLGRMKNEGQDLNLVLQGLGVTEIRQADTLRSLALSGDNLSKSIQTSNQAWKDNTALTEEARKRFETTASQLTILWNRIQDVGITIGNALLPTIKSLVGLMGDLIPVINFFAEGFAALPQPIQTVAIGLGAMAAAIGPLLYVMGQLAISASAVSGAFAAKGIATKALTVLVSAMGPVYTILTAEITAQGIAATATATANGILMAANTTLMTSVSLLTTGVQTLWALIAAHPLTAAIAAIGAITLATTKWYEASKQKELQAAEEGAKQDSINLAIQRGAAATISYTDAIKFNDEWQKKRLASTADATAATNDQNQASDAAAAKIAQLNAGIAALTATQRSQITELHNLGESNKQIAADTGVSEQVIDAYLKTTAKAAGETNKFANEIKNLTDQMSGQGLLQQAQMYEQVVAKIGGSSNLTAEESRKYNQVLLDVIDKYSRMGPSGQAVVDHFTALRNSMMPLPPIIQEADVALTSLGKHVDIKPPTLEFTQFGLSVEDLQRKGLFASATVQELGFMMAKLPAGIDPATTSIAKFRKENEDAAISFSEVWTDALSDLPNLLIKAFTGGGGISGALQALTTELTAGLFGENGPLASIKTGIAGMFGESGLGAMVGQAISAWLPGIGALIGPAIEGLKKLFGGPSQEELDARAAYAAWQETIIEQFDQMATGAQKNEAAGEEWKKVNILVRDAYIEVGKTGEQAMTDIGIALDATHHSADEVQAAVGRINDVLEEQKAHTQLVDESMRTLDDTVKKYGFTIEELGPALQRQNLDKQAQELYQDFQVLIAAGIEVGTVTTRMSDSINEYVANALRTGTEVPAAMQPMIEKMIEMGLLTDANGNKITTLEGSGITFSESMTQGFTKVVSAVERLTKAIAEGLGLALPEVAETTDTATQDMAGSLDRLKDQNTETTGKIKNDWGNCWTNVTGDADAKFKQITAIIQGQTGVSKDVANQILAAFQKTFNDTALTADQKVAQMASIISSLTGVSSQAAQSMAQSFYNNFFGVQQQSAQTAYKVTTDLFGIKVPNINIPMQYNIPDLYLPQPHVYVPVTYYPTNDVYAARGGLVTAFGIQHFAGGGEVLAMPEWDTRGTDTVPAMLTPNELVMTEADTGQIAATVESAAQLAKQVTDSGGPGGGGGGITIEKVEIHAVDAASFEALIRRSPGVVAQAAVEGLERGYAAERFNTVSTLRSRR